MPGPTYRALTRMLAASPIPLPVLLHPVPFGHACQCPTLSTLSLSALFSALSHAVTIGQCCISLHFCAACESREKGRKRKARKSVRLG